ncbi:MAG TPA: FliH/SctL family protein [Bryobacteraceae bacterium]|nr:FliH/SctL family protein [Bryobacteraceae bacterium]
MPTEILGGEQPVHTRVSWRSAPPVTALRRSHAGANSEHEISSRLEQARRQGYADGVAAARLEAEQKILPAVHNLAFSLGEIARLPDLLRQEAAGDVVQLAICMASRVLHRDVSVDPGALGGLLSAAFLKLRAQETNRVRVHPALEPMLRQCLQQCAEPANPVLINDPDLKPGDIRFETSRGTLHGDSVELQEIERGLADRLEE